MSDKHPYIASGFKEDCSQLLSLFKEENDIRFETFCNTWQKMKFSLVFLGRENFADLLEFCEEVLYIAKQFILQPYFFKERIGGLYLLYGLYYKMPLENMAKIRITSTDFIQIVELHKEIREGEHLDANYILSKMFVDDAFAFCMFNKEMGLQKQHKTVRIRMDNQLSVFPSVHSMNKPNGVLQKIKNLSKQYEEQKQGFAKSINSEKVIKLFDPDILGIMDDFYHLDQGRNNSSITGNLEPKKKASKPAYKIRPVLGHGFDTDSSENEDNDNDEIIDNLKLSPCKTEFQTCLNDIPMSDGIDEDKFKINFVKVNSMEVEEQSDDYD